MNKFAKKLLKVLLITITATLGFVVACALFVGFTTKFTYKQPLEQSLAKQDSIPLTREELLRLTNERRAEVGVSPLSLDETLNGTAQEKCVEIVRTGTPEHDSNTLQSMADELNRSVSENLAEGYGSPQQAIDAWMDSPSHRENMLDDEWNQVGFGLCESNSLGNIVVQHFSN